MVAALSDGTIQLRDISTGRLLRKIDQRASSVAISPDRLKLGVAAPTGLVFFSFESGLQLQTIEVNSPAQTVVYADDGRQLISTHADGTTKSWNAQTNELLTTRVAYTSGDWVTITPEGFFDASENGAVLGLTKPTTTDRVQTLRKSLALAPGENRIEVFAFNAQGYMASIPAQVTVNSTRPVPTKSPRLFVLAAGINEYQAKSFTKLNFAKADAAAIGTALKQAGGRLYESVEVTTLFDHEVTAAKLDSAFDMLAEKIAPDDVFMLFLAGHGSTIDGRFYYLPHDYVYGPAEVATKAIS
ncbi:MAG: hypothetical protein OJF48_004506 [Afipia sp.]|jgi:hypothetical protein|nr:MAG: hypothetical protein OJF48_004506 [Afipia sp.]